MELLQGERLDDLQVLGLKIIQNPTKYCFTSDAVLLANTARAKRLDKVCDLCCGSGIIAILIAAKQKVKKVVGVEIQPSLADMAKRSVMLNDLGEQVEIMCESVQQCRNTLDKGSFDVVVANPPYEKKGVGQYFDNSIAICRSEIELEFFELADCASDLLKYGGKFFLIHRADRLAELIFELKKVNLEPKVITLIYPTKSKAPNTVIIESVKGGKPSVKIKSLVIYEHNNTYTDDAKKLYSME